MKGHRIILSGTPLQNNLSELWSIFDLVQPKIFGSYEVFEKHFASKIERGLLKDSLPHEKREAQELSRKLRLTYQDHFLRRTKKNIFTTLSAELVQRPLKMTEMPLKTDFVVWMPLTPAQKTIYTFMLSDKNLQQLIASGEITSAFFILSYIKKLCLHPALMASLPASKKS